MTKAYDKLEEMGIGKEEVKGILHFFFDFVKSHYEIGILLKLAVFAKSLFE